MVVSLRLGLRLAWGTAEQRRRSLLIAGSSASGTVVLLVVLGILGLPQVHGWFGGPTTEFARLQAAIVGSVALPVVALAGTVGRLSASLRDRRLANLRLLGLTAAQTRVVGATEAGVAAAFGSLAGLVCFEAIRAVPGHYQLAGITLRLHELRPDLLAHTVATLALPLVVTAVAGIPQRLDPRRGLERAARADGRRPSWWRLVPILVGIVLSRWFWHGAADHQLSSRDIALFFSGTVSTGLGLVLVVPVFSRLVADLLMVVARRPATLIAARRLQAQPAAVTRIVAALMIGLYLVVGARAVLAAFESTGQYLAAQEALTQRQWAVVSTDPQGDARLVQEVGAVSGVTDVVALPVLTGWSGVTYRDKRGADVPAVVGTCRDLQRVAPTVSGCVDGRPLWLMPRSSSPPSQVTLTLARNPAKHHRQRLTLDVSDALDAHVSGARGGYGSLPLSASLLLPPSEPDLARFAQDAPRAVVVVARPGRDLVDNLTDDAGVNTMYAPDFQDYDYVAGLRAILYAIAAVVLSVGLLTFGIAAIDRAISRRAELASLQVLGTPVSVLRQAQWLEALIPTITGTLLAISTGLFSGITYLHLGDDTWQSHLHLIWPATATLAGLALIISMFVAGLTVLATGSKLTPDVIRTE